MSDETIESALARTIVTDDDGIFTVISYLLKKFYADK
jgi:hypothetical protein